MYRHFFTLVQNAVAVHQQRQAVELVNAFKLGLDDRDVQEVRRFASSDEKTAESLKPSVGTKKKKETVEAPVSSPVPAKVSPRQEKVAALLKLINSSKSRLIRLRAYQDLLALKKASKVSWAKLNVENFDTIQAMFEEK